MPIKKLTLGLVLLTVVANLANANYTVKEGDTLSHIAQRLHVSTSALKRANGLSDKSRLKIGQKLIVPKAGSTKVTSKDSVKSTKVSSGAQYTVRSGDNDWIIARRAGTTVKQLKALNPNVNFVHLKIGATLRLPAGADMPVATSRIRSRYAAIKGSNVTIRRGPSTSNEAICTIDAGTRVSVLEREGSWYKLRFPKGTVGWVRGDFLSATSAPKTRVAKSSRRSKRSTYTASMRRTPRSKYVVAPITGGGDLLAKANSFRGVRYSYGSASRSGTDCSGFTTQVFRSQGVALPRTSRDQATVGNKIDKSSLGKGDLVFFRTGRGRRITHVGIYMGNGKFIHASSGGGKVQVNSLNDGYYANRFVTARRVPTKKKK